MAKRRPIGEEPDGLVWWDSENECFANACAKCAHVGHYVARTEGEVWRLLLDHLWFVHRERKVWVNRFDHSTDAAVQAALPFVLDAESRARTRHLNPVPPKAG